MVDGGPPSHGIRRVVQHCPWCGELVGSFWGRRAEDESHWCESCQAFFRVLQVEGSADAAER